MRKCSKWFYKSYKNIWNKVMFNKVGIKGLFEIRSFGTRGMTSAYNIN